MWPNHMVFNGSKLLGWKGLQCLWTSISYNRLRTKQPGEGVHAWFLMGIYTRFENIFCSCWNKFNCFDFWSHYAICKCFKVVNPMQVVQYTSNRFYDNNKYINRLNTCKYVTRCICLQLFIILGSQCNFLCELEINNQNNLV